VRIAKKVLKYGLYGGVVFVLLLVLLAAATQTQFFRDRLRAAALSRLDSLLTASVYLGNLQGNLISGFSVDSISLVVDGGPFLSAKRLDFRYNLLGIPGKTISIDRIILVRPVVHLFRNGVDGWNLKRIIRPSPADTAAPHALDWVLTLRRFEIQEGTLVLLDSASLADPEHSPRDSNSVEYHDFTLHDLNLVISGSIKKQETRLNIESLSFVSARPDVRLRHFSSDLLLTPSLARISNLEIQTARSSVTLQASMKEINLLGGIDLAELRHKPVALSLKAHDLDLDELKQFIPQIRFLHEPVSMTFDASGEFGDVNVQKLELQMRHTRLNLKGTVANLHDPGNLRLNVKLADSKIVPADPLALMPDFNLPDLSSIGVATVNMEFEGTPLDFRAKVHLLSDAGEVHSGDMLMKIGGPRKLAYKGDLSVRRLDLAKLFGDPRLESTLQGSVAVEGEGLGMENLRGSLDIRMDSSEFRFQPLENSRVTLTAENHRLEGKANVRLGGMNSTIIAVLDAENKDLPRFSIDGSVESLDLEDLFSDKKFNSDITMTITVSGSGLSLAKMSGEASLDLTSSRYGDYQLESGDIHIFLDQQDPRNKTLRLESNVADLSVTGAFDLTYLTQLIRYEIQDLRYAVGTKFPSLDSSIATAIDRRKLMVMEKSLSANHDLQDAEIVLAVKDLEPLSKVTTDGTFNGNGFFVGWIKGDYRDLSCHGQLTVNEFVYGNVESGLLVQDGSVSFTISRLKPTHPLKEIMMDLHAGVGSLHLNRNALDSVSLGLSYQRELLDWSVSSEWNNGFRVAAKGDASVAEDSLAVRIGSLRTGYQGFAWTAEQGAGVRFTGHNLEVSNLVLTRDTQTVAFRGKLESGGAIAATIEGTHLDLDDLRFLLPSEELEQNQKTFTGATFLRASVGGTVADPELTATVRISDMAFRGVPFGQLVGDFAYQRRLLDVRMWVDNAAEGTNDVPELTVAGTLPLNLALTDVDDRIPDEPMNLTVHTDGLQMSILDPVVPTFRHLNGIMKCTLTVGGTLRHPDYQGNITISDCSFLFVPNNINYQFSGTFKPEGELVRVIDATVRNVPGDERGGRRGAVNITGDFSLKNLRPGDFNLRCTGDLLVVKETSQLTALSVYGNLFVEIGAGGLHFTGSIEQSLLKGAVLIRNSSLVFPPTQQSVSEESAMSVPLVFVDDTSRVTQMGARSAFAKYFGLTGRRPAKNLATNEPGKPSRSFMDGVRYDLDIETTGDNTEIRMIFNTMSGEELVATLNGNFSITEDGRRWVGDMQVSRAYYNFYKRFDAEGRIRYTGDLLNPELDIRARYQGQRALRDSVASGPPEKVVVSFKITGTRNEPKIEFSMTINDIDYYTYRGPKSNDVQSDAIQFILYGSFPLTTAQKNEIPTDVQKTFGLSLLTGATSLLTARASEFLRDQTGFINSVELSYDGTGNFGSSADIRLSGVLWKGYWRYGGKILDDPLNNANFSLLYSFDAFFADPPLWLRNLMFELERRVETGSTVQSYDIKRVDSARLFYRFSF